MRRRSSSRRRERAHDVENKRRWRYWQRTSCPHAGMGTRWGIYWGPLHQAMSKKPLAVGEIVSLLPAVMLKAPADSAAYASSFFAPADAPEHLREPAAHLRANAIPWPTSVSSALDRRNPRITSRPVAI
jgi:hypothetical protein